MANHGRLPWKKPDMVPHRRLPLVVRYGLSVALVAAAWGLRWALTLWVGPGLPPYSMYYAAIMLIALLAGLGPGLMATVLVGLIVTYWYLPPIGHFSILSPVDRLAQFMFLCTGILVSIVAELYWRMRARIVTYEHEAALFRNQQSFKALVDNAPDIIARFDRQFRHLFVNPRVEKVTGLKVADYLGKTNEEMGMPGELCEQWNSCIRAAFESGKEQTSEFMFPSVCGPTYYDMRLVPEFAPDGTVEAVISVARDITERKRTEEALRANEARFRAAFDCSSVPMSLTKLDGRIVRVNEAFCQMMGYCDAELRSLTFYDFTFPDDMIANRMGVQHLLDGTQDSFRMEKRYKKKDGRIIWGDMSSAVVRDEGGRPIYMVTHVQDITLRKEAEEALKDSSRAALNLMEDAMIARRQAEKINNELRLREEQLQASETQFRILSENSPDSIALHDLQFRHLYVNPTLAHVVGQPQAAFVGRTLSEVGVPLESAKEIEQNLHRTLVTEREYLTDLTYQTPEGLRSFQWRSVPVPGPDGKTAAILVVITDITARKQSELALRQTSQELARSNEDLEQFAYVCSHDLKEPLRMVSGFAGLLKERYQGRLDAKADEYIGFASDAALRMQGLIDDLLAYSRVGRNKTSVAIAAGSALDRALKNLRTSIREVEAEVTHDPLPVIQANELEMTQLFQNLIGNSLKFHRPNQPCQIHVGAQKIEKSEGAGSGHWRFSVHDNGIGIESQYVDRIFMIFQRLHTREEYPGTGVGLAICKKIVERHGGRIWVESEPGKGSTFFFTLPGEV